MSKAKKKAIRWKFREAVFARAGERCEARGYEDGTGPRCGYQAVDAHHITSRDDMPDGGYTIDNGVALCAAHHMLCEEQQDQPDGAVRAWYRPEMIRKWIVENMR